MGIQTSFTETGSGGSPAIGSTPSADQGDGTVPAITTAEAGNAGSPVIESTPSADESDDTVSAVTTAETGNEGPAGNKGTTAKGSDGSYINININIVQD